MITARIDGVPVPLVFSQQETVQLIGEEERTGTGALRRNVFAIKRVWRLQTRPMPKADKDALAAHLHGILFTAVDFWLDEFGPETNTVRAYVELEEERTVETDRHSLSIVVEEE